MTEDVIKSFAKRLRYLREQKGLSQEALANLCDIDRTYIGRLENIKRAPGIVVLDKIARGLEIPLHELVNFEDM